MGTAMELAREGFAAWQRGDLDGLESMLDPAVQWGSFEPGEWDCHDRHDVMRTLRDRLEQGFNRGALEFVEAGEDRVVVVAHPSEVGGPEWPDETATMITFRDGKVVEMQDYPTRSEALEAAGIT